MPAVTLAAAIVALSVASPALGQTVYYWDTNGATAGFGTASGTWGGSSFFSTNAAGTAATTSVTTTLSDELNFGTASAGLATGTVTVSGSQSIRSLVFGSQSGVLTLSGGTIGLAASGTITANQASNTNTIDSILAGAATGLVKNGAGTAILTQANTYSGSTSVTAGTLTLGGANGSVLSSGVIGVTGATFTLDNATNNNSDRLGSGAAVTLNAGATLLFNGNGATASTTEAFGNLGFGGGQATVTLGNTGAGQLQTLAATSVSRAAGAVALVRGASLQTAATNATRLTIGGTAGTGLVFVGAGTSALGAATNGTDKTLRIVPYLVGDTSATGNGSSFLTYDVNATAFGLRPLATNEYTTLAAGYTTPATAENVNAFNGTISTAGPTVNSLRFATSSQTLNGSGVLTVNSGAILATQNTTAIGSGFSGVSLGNGTWNEGVIQVASGATFTVNAPISVTGGGGLTKGLAGTLALNAANTYSGDTVVNAGNLTLGASGLLGSGSYTGAVRALGAATVTLTNTASQVFAGGLSSAGLLTLNAPGAISISGGLTTSAGLTVGANAGTTTIAGPWTNNSGNVSVGSGKVLSFEGDALTAPLAQTITGGGTLAFTSGSAAFGGPAVVHGAGLTLTANVIQSGGRVSGSGGQGLWVGNNGSHGSYTITGGTLALAGSQPGGTALILAYTNSANSTNGTLTIDGDSALVSVRSTAGVSTITWSWGGSGVSNGTLNLARGELQYAAESVWAGAGSPLALFNLGGPSGTATIRPVDSNGLTLNAAITRTLVGSNGVINSTDVGGVARSVTVNGAIGESGGSRGLSFAGSGTTTITGTNTYSGTTWLREGTLRTSSTTPFLNSPLEISAGATFVAGISGTATYSLVGLSGSGTVSLGGNTLRVGGNNDSTTYGGAITGAGGGLVKTGSGSLVLTGSSAYTGPTTIGSGVIQIGNGSTTGALNAASAISGSAAAGIIFNRSDNYGGTISNLISGPVNLTHLGSGTLALVGANSYTGTSTISGGVVNLGVAENSGVSGPLGTNTAVGAILLTGGTLQYSAANAFDYSGRFSAAAGQQFNVDTNSRNVAWATGLAGAGNTLTKSGAGTLTLNAANTYSGDTVVNAGNLTLGASGLLGSGSYTGAVRVLGGATLTLSNTASQVFAGGLSSAGLLTLNTPGAISISGGLTTSAGLTVGANAGSVAISGPWTNIGTITIATGKEVAFSNGTISATSAVLVTSGGAFAFASGTLNAANNAQNSINNTAFNQSGGLVSFVNSNAAQNAFRIGNNADASYTVTGGTLDASSQEAAGALVVAYQQFATVTTGTLAINGPTARVVVRDGNAGGRMVVGWNGTGGRGVLNFTEGEIQLGRLTVYGGGQSGTVTIGGTTGSMTIRPFSGDLELGSAGLTYTLAGNNGVVSSSDQNGVARTVTLQGAVGETGGRRNLEFTGLGTTILNAANTYSGTTRLTGGTLQLGNLNAVQNSTVDVGGVVTFTVAGTGTYAFGGLAGSTGLGIGGNTLRVGGNNDSTTYGGAITGAGGGLVKAGSGSLVLTAVQAFTGATTITGGRLEIGAAGGINAASGITIDGGELRYNAATALTKPITFTAGTISGTGTIGSAVAVAAGDVLAPGNSPGTQAYSGLLGWNPGGTYQWELNALAGVAGTNWDLINVTSGTFSLAGLSTSPGSQFVLDLVTLDAVNQAGPLAIPFDGGSYTMAIASYNPANFVLPTGLGLTNTAGTDLTGLFQINLANWHGTQPAIGNISVKINSAANGIDLVIVPEPATLMLVAGGVAAAALRLRRRSSCRSPGR